MRRRFVNLSFLSVLLLSLLAGPQAYSQNNPQAADDAAGRASDSARSQSQPDQSRSEGQQASGEPSPDASQRQVADQQDPPRQRGQQAGRSGRSQNSRRNQAQASRRQESQQDERPQEEGEQSPRRQASRGRVSGEVVQTRRVNLRGTDVQHLIVLLENDRGQRVPVDLGSIGALRPDVPRQGERVVVDGRIVRIGNRRLVVGERVGLGDEGAAMRRTDVSALERSRQAANRRDPSGRSERQDAQARAERPAGLGVGLAQSTRTPGVRVLRVDRDSPAAEAGIRPGDIITFVDDEFVNAPRQLIEVVAERDPGERVSLLIQRDGQRRRVTTQLTTRQEALDAPPVRSRPRGRPAPRQDAFGGADEPGAWYEGDEFRASDYNRYYNRLYGYDYDPGIRPDYRPYDDEWFDDDYEVYDYGLFEDDLYDDGGFADNYGPYDMDDSLYDEAFYTDSPYGRGIGWYNGGIYDRYDDSIFADEDWFFTDDWYDDLGYFDDWWGY